MVTRLEHQSAPCTPCFTWLEGAESSGRRCSAVPVCGVACGLWAVGAWGVWGQSHGTARRAVEGWTTRGPGSPCGRRTKCETSSKFPEIQSVKSAPPPFVTSR